MNKRFGVWGLFIGMILCIFIFPPFGVIVGGFLGAVAGELLAGKEGDDAMNPLVFRLTTMKGRIL